MSLPEKVKSKLKGYIRGIDETVNFNGQEIHLNTGSGTGGGILRLDDGSIRTSDGSIISKGDEDSGGGVYGVQQTCAVGYRTVWVAGQQRQRAESGYSASRTPRQFTASDQTAMLALSGVVRGDLCYREDTYEVFTFNDFLNNQVISSLANWGTTSPVSAWFDAGSYSSGETVTLDLSVGRKQRVIASSDITIALSNAGTNGVRDGTELDLYIFSSGGSRTISISGNIYYGDILPFPRTLASDRWVKFQFEYVYSQWNLVDAIGNIIWD